jgi:murein L,D-transpeptidase YafK
MAGSPGGRGASGLAFRTGYIRTLMASAALAAVVALAGCETDGLRSGKAMKELSPEMKAELTQKNMPIESPILVRLFKQEAELEVWKQDAGGRYELLKTYPICRWSGELGPKIREGDRQAPEGFYNITPASMNPNSQFYLSINTGYPNAFDRSHQRTGAALMIHGDCSSRGCYAMTDDQISEIYALARESFFGGQRSLQLQAYPFRMTPANFAKHRNNPNIAFWKMLKEGNDHFEVTHQEPKVEFCDKRYVFNPEASQTAAPASSVRLGTPWGGLREQPQQAATALNFSPAGRCPAYVVADEVRDAVAAKRRQDEAQTAALISRGITAAPVRTGRDGGMHPTFLALLKPQEVREPDGTVRYMVDENAAKRLGSYVNPPLETEPVSPAVATPAAAPRATPKPAAYAVAAAESREAPPPAPRQQQSGSMFASLFSSNESSPPPQQDSMFGRMKSFFVGDDRAPPAKPQPAAKQAAPAPKSKPQPKPEPVQAAAAPAAAPAPVPTAANAGLLNGAQPTVPVGSFDQRWGAVR